MTGVYVVLAVSYSIAACSFAALYMWLKRPSGVPVAGLSREERFWEAQLTTQPDLAAYDDDFARWEANR